LEDCRPGDCRIIQETQPPLDDSKPGHVCDYDRRCPNECSVFTAEPALRGFVWQLAIWLWFTVLFANFAEAMAEGRGRAQAAALRRHAHDHHGPRLTNGREEKVPATDLQKGDTVVCETGDVIPADGDVIEGIASVDEAAITGESAPVIRESGGDRSAVTGGTRVLSDRIVVRVTMDKGHGFLDRMIALVEGRSGRKRLTRSRSPSYSPR
jgi:K+-transporting ATPase ATPase B chain